MEERPVFAEVTQLYARRMVEDNALIGLYRRRRKAQLGDVHRAAFRKTLATVERMLEGQRVSKDEEWTEDTFKASRVFLDGMQTYGLLSGIDLVGHQLEYVKGAIEAILAGRVISPEELGAVEQFIMRSRQLSGEQLEGYRSGAREEKLGKWTLLGHR